MCIYTVYKIYGPNREPMKPGVSRLPVFGGFDITSQFLRYYLPISSILPPIRLRYYLPFFSSVPPWGISFLGNRFPCQVDLVYVILAVVIFDHHRVQNLDHVLD